MEDFEPPVGNVPPGQAALLTSTLEGNVPNVDPNFGWGFPNGLANKNLIIQTNPVSPNAPHPDPGSNIAAVGQDLWFPGLPNSIVVGPNFNDDSLDLIFDPGENHTGIGFDVFNPFVESGDTIHIAVFDKGNVEIAKEIVPAQQDKFFFGIWCGETIGRINIAGMTVDLAPDFEIVDNIQMWMEPEQAPTCPWDCGTPHNKVVDIIDFLALLGQWGQLGPCDFDGGGVGITDFLKLLGMWGPCPAPLNDECIDYEPIDKTDPNGITVVHFDMYGATPSPEPFKCLDLPPKKDIWYCLTNVTGTKIGVTITTNVDLFIEVNEGCVCPPSPVVITCGEGLLGLEQFEMQDGEQVLIRLYDWLDLPNEELKGSMFIENKELFPESVNFFEDPELFYMEIEGQGKFSKGAWAFKPDYVPIGTLPIPIDDVLDINTHYNNASGVWWDGVVNLWPPEIDNVQFSSNMNPQGPWEPFGPAGMVYLKPGSVPDIDNNALTEFVLGSFTIISGQPQGANHTAMALDLVSWDENGVNDPIDWHITVYDKADMVIGKYRFPGHQPAGKVFLGMITKDPSITIGRVDIWDEVCSYEGISFIELFQQGEPPQVNFYTDDVLFYEAINQAGKIDKFWWDFKPHNQIPHIPTLLDFLDIFSHWINGPDDPWAGPGGQDLWNPVVDNVQFVSNAQPQGPLDPAGGMVFLHPGNYPGIENNALVEAFGQASFDIISGQPQGANHTAFAMELISVEGLATPSFHISVYDKADVEIGKFMMSTGGEKAFLGILTKDPDITIGRIDIWDQSLGAEGVSWLSAFLQIPPPAAPGPDLGSAASP
jgi:hypothetical protein